MIDMILKISVVQAYINHITGKTVQINIPNTQIRLQLLEEAYAKATSYFNENNGIVRY